MPFFLDGNPTQGEISEAINYLLGNAQQTTSTDIGTGQVTDATGNIVSYLYKYLQIKYADSFDGTLNFSNTPTNRLYYGLRNTDSSTESTNPTDYIWTQVTGGFGTTKQIFYSVTGGRRIELLAALAAPSALYQADNGSAIDLDVISGSDGASSRICYAKSTSTSLASTPVTYQTSGDSSFPPTNTWGGGETWQATPPTLSVNEALFQSDGIYNPMTDLTTWNVPYLSNLKVGALSAITANMGTLTSGEIIVGSSPNISGTTMTGAGSHLYGDGRYALGNSSTNIVFNGTELNINGLIDTSTTFPSVSLSLLPTQLSVFVMNFYVQKAGTVIVSFNFQLQSVYPTTAISTSTLVELSVKNSLGTTVSRAYGVSYIGPLARFGSISGATISVPFFQALNLPAGSYEVYASTTTSQTRGYDSAGGYVAFTEIDMLNIVGAIYQAKI